MTLTTPCRVLCVDDNQDSAGSLAQLLRIVGFEARACFDGYSALEAATEFHPDVCLLDISMPGMDGYELARRLRGVLDRPVIMAVTAVTGSDFEQQATAAGFDRWFTKPANPRELLDAISSMRGSG